MKKRSLRAVAALALSASMMTGNVLAANVSFKDVPSTHWSYSYVKRATEKGLVAGVGDGRYGVDDQLSIGQFATMLCGLIYPNEASKYQVSNASWWYPYLEAAYQKGALAGTVAGDRRAADKKWTASVVEAGMNRYDLAQVIYNVSKSQGWGTPSTTEMFFAMASIPDWSEVPTQYQNAVATAYAKSYLSGVDSKGTFGGKNTMTRGQVAVVLCSMMDAKSKMDAPTYTNRSGKLVDGKDANEDNVKSALKTLQYEFYEYDIWDTSRVYTSAKLGTGSGSQGFAYMLSDRVFGALPVQTQSNANRLKPGDVVYLRSEGQYVVVTSVSSSKFTYAACDSLGIITWRGSYDIDDLGSRDTIYTRYEGAADNDTLANGDEATEKNVKSLLKSLKSQKGFKNGTEWDERHDSDVFGRASGDEGFAYMVSDEIFGDLDYREVNSVYDMRAGDIVYRKSDKVYLIVLNTDSSDNTFTYLYLNDDYEICWCENDWITMSRNDTVYTRYPEDAASDGTLSNGKDATAKNVSALIAAFLEEEYDEGDVWTSSHKSTVMGSGRVYGSEAFAYCLSDYIFGDLDVSKSNIASIAVGDVIELAERGNDDEYIYVVVTGVSARRVDYLYAKYSSKYDEYTIATGSKQIADMNDRSDIVYTRYPD